MRVYLLADRQPSFHSLHNSTSGEGLFGVSIIRVLISFMRTPLSWTKHLPYAPSLNCITLGVRISTLCVWEGHDHLIHRRQPLPKWPLRRKAEKCPSQLSDHCCQCLPQANSWQFTGSQKAKGLTDIIHKSQPPWYIAGLRSVESRSGGRKEGLLAYFIFILRRGKLRLKGIK